MIPFSFARLLPCLSTLYVHPRTAYHLEIAMLKIRSGSSHTVCIESWPVCLPVGVVQLHIAVLLNDEALI